jgi:hypothetical protein
MVKDFISLPPEPLKARGIGGGVANRVLNVAVSEIVLNEPGVRTLIGEGIAAGVAQHVGMNRYGQPGQLAIVLQGIIDRRAMQGLKLFANKESRTEGLERQWSRASLPSSRLKPFYCPIPSPRNQKYP